MKSQMPSYSKDEQARRWLGVVGVVMLATVPVLIAAAIIGANHEADVQSDAFRLAFLVFFACCAIEIAGILIFMGHVAKNQRLTPGDRQAWQWAIYLSGGGAAFVYWWRYVR